MTKLQEKSVLIIDDDAAMLRALDKVLTGEGAKVTSVEWAYDALEEVTNREKKFDLVISDLRMPFMKGVLTGLTVIHSIHEMLPGLPIIVLTAFASSDVRAECLRRGAVAFLEKPLDTTQLLAALESVWPD
jgi:CheY-like chemotaxis protein